MKGFKMQPGTTWKDVCDLIREFEEEFNCRLTITVGTAVGKGFNKPYLVVRGLAEHGPSRSIPCWQRQYVLEWPTYGSRTMAGLYARLIWEFAESLRIRPPRPGKGVLVPGSPLG